MRSPPDGLTFAVVYSSHAANPALLTSLPYDSEKDFEPVAFIWRAATALSEHPSVAINNFAQFLAEAKSKPGSIAYGTPGVGSAMHLAGALLEDRAGIVLTHIPYRGAGPALADAVAGGVPAVISNVSTTAPQARFGKLRPLATTGPQRSILLPDIPTISESGYPGYDVAEFMVLVARAGTPIEILDRKHRAILNVVAAPAMATKLAEQGLDTQPMSRAEVKTWLAAQTRTLSDLIRKAGIKPE